MENTVVQTLGMTSRKRLAFMLVCLLQLADFVSTRSVMALHGTVELNPLLRSVNGRADMFKVVAAKLLACALAYFLIRRAQRLRLIWVACAIYWVIVMSNWLLLP